LSKFTVNTKSEDTLTKLDKCLSSYDLALMALHPTRLSESSLLRKSLKCLCKQIPGKFKLKTVGEYADGVNSI